MTRGVERSEKAVFTPCWRGFNTPACGPGVKSVLPFWKMHKTDALNAVRKDPFSDKYTQVIHERKDQGTAEENYTYLF